MPILASLNPSCERFYSERFEFVVQWLWTSLCRSLNLRWIAWVMLLHLRFLFTRLPSSWRCGLAETVGLCFRVDSDRATLVFVLGLVCVCVFVLFCSVVVLFVEGWKQHCRYIVIDAMVYPKNWRLEDKFSTGKTLKSLDWIWYSYIWFQRFVFQQYMSWRSSWLELHESFRRLRTTELWIWKLRHCAWVSRDEFWVMIYHLSLCLSLIIFWSRMWPGTMNTPGVQFV